MDEKIGKVYDNPYVVGRVITYELDKQREESGRQAAGVANHPS